VTQTSPLAPFRGLVWRILPADLRDEVLAPAAAPEGRFHHDGQRALYASLTAEGAGVAIARYVAADQTPRIIVPLRLGLTRVRDLRVGPDPARASVVWQEARAQGEPAPTWAYSDAARADGAEAMLYLSRSRPDLTHIVLFDWSAATVAPDGPPCPWP